jgi:hypothetical protein
VSPPESVVFLGRGRGDSSSMDPSLPFLSPSPSPTGLPLSFKDSNIIIHLSFNQDCKAGRKGHLWDFCSLNHPSPASELKCNQYRTGKHTHTVQSEAAAPKFGLCLCLSSLMTIFSSWKLEIIIAFISYSC